MKRFRYLQTLGGRSVLALACAVALLVLANNAKANKKSDNQNGPDLLIGKPAPGLSFRAYGSSIPVDLNDLRGKMVVVDFFQAEGKANAADFDDVIGVEHDFGPKGIVVVGVCIDEIQSPMSDLLHKKPGIDWPIYYDAMGWAGPTSQLWKASWQTGPSNYEAFLHLDYVIAPDGTVLWAGNPAGLSKAVEDQLKDHKPQLVDPRIMTDAKASLDKIGTDLTDQKIGKAFQERSHIPQSALQDDDFAAQVKDTDDKLTAAGNAALAEIDPLIAEKDFPTAVAKLKDLSTGAEGTTFGTKAKAKLIELQKSPEARAALQAAEKNSRANDDLKIAQKLQTDKKDIQAYSRFKLVAKNYPGSPAAQTATDAITAYDADPAFKKKLAGAGAGTPTTTPSDAAKPDPSRAKGLLNLANSYRDSGNFEKAKTKYQDVLAQFPGTPEADAAKDELAKLPQ